MKLYAVTKGIYSDYHILALVSNRERAEKILAFFSQERPGCDPDAAPKIEEFEDGVPEGKGFPWEYDVEDGRAYLIDDRDEEFWWQYETGTVLRKLNGSIYGIDVIATDRERAEKIARDILAQKKAETAGIC